MLRVTTLFICVFALGLTFCSSKNDRTYPYQLSKIDRISFPLDHESAYEPAMIQYVESEGEELLYVQNNFINGINIYSLTKEELNKKIRIPKEGPNSVWYLQGFTVLNKDSIYVFGRGTLTQTLLLNSAGETISSLDFSEEVAERVGIINHISTTYAPTIYHDKKLYFTVWPDVDLGDPKNINNSHSFELAYDFRSKELKQEPIHFPKLYHNKIWSIYNFGHSRTKGHRDLFVYSWNISDSILITNFKDHWQWHNAKADGFKDKAKPFQKQPSLGDGTEIAQAIEHDSYPRLWYDAYRKVYYRIGLKAIEYNKNKHKGYKASNFQPITLIVLNEKFEKVAETRIEDKVYSWRQCFVGKKGLYIPESHPENPHLKEDEINFSVFALEKNEIL